MNWAAVMPHKAPMLLLDDVTFCSKEKLVSAVKITKDSFGFSEDGVPSWFGIEYMAQSIAAYNGLNYSTGGKPEIGFLVGARGYASSAEKFSLGAELEVTVTPTFIIENSGSFHCEIKINGGLVAEATVTTFKPDQKFIEELKGERP